MSKESFVNENKSKKVLKKIKINFKKRKLYLYKTLKMKTNK